MFFKIQRRLLLEMPWRACWYWMLETTEGMGIWSIFKSSASLFSNLPSTCNLSSSYKKIASVKCYRSMNPYLTRLVTFASCDVDFCKLYFRVYCLGAIICWLFHSVSDSKVFYCQLSTKHSFRCYKYDDLIWLNLA